MRTPPNRISRPLPVPLKVPSGLAPRAVFVGTIVLLAEWAAASIRGGLPSVSPGRIVEAALVALACCFVGAITVALIVHIGRSAVRRLGQRTERFIVESGICILAGLGVALEVMTLCSKVGVPVYGPLGLAQPWQPGLVWAVGLASFAVALATFASIKRRGSLVALLTAIIWLHLAVGPAYLDMAARVSPRRHLLLVVLSLATLDVLMARAQPDHKAGRSHPAWSLFILLAACVWAAAPFLASNDAKLVVGGRMSVPYRVLAVSVAAPWAPGGWQPIADTGPTNAVPLTSRPMTQPSRGVVVVLVDTLRPDALAWRSNGRPLAPNLLRAQTESKNWSHAYATYPGTVPSVSAMFGHTASPSLLTSLRTHGIRSVAVSSSGPLVAPDFDEVDESVRPTGATHRMDRHSDKVTLAALRHLDRLMGGQENFLLLVHYMAPHGPYVGNGSRTAAPRDKYGDEVAYVDQAMAPLLLRLREAALAGDLTVVVASDHGEEFLEHGYRTHGLRVYEESMRIVLFASGPGMQSGESMTAVSGADLAPTLAELLGVSGIAWASGRDESPEREERVIHLSGAMSFGCVRGNIKWICDTEIGYCERYNLLSDPEESMNGADSHDVPEWCATRTR